MGQSNDLWLLEGQTYETKSYQIQDPPEFIKLSALSADHKEVTEVWKPYEKVVRNFNSPDQVYQCKVCVCRIWTCRRWMQLLRYWAPAVFAFKIGKENVCKGEPSHSQRKTPCFLRLLADCPTCCTASSPKQCKSASGWAKSPAAFPGSPLPRGSPCPSFSSPNASEASSTALIRTSTKRRLQMLRKTSSFPTQAGRGQDISPRGPPGAEPSTASSPGEGTAEEKPPEARGTAGPGLTWQVLGLEAPPRLADQRRLVPALLRENDKKGEKRERKRGGVRRARGTP